MNITLIGYRGSGKTTVGKLLAARLAMTFVDTDALLVARAGQTIKQIFETQGEPAFRDLESAVVADVAARNNHVIATGGGVVLRPANTAALKAAGKIVYLSADPATLLARIHADPATAKDRPALTAGGVSGGTLEEITRLLATREPLYRAAADLTLDVTALSPAAAAEAIATRLGALIG